ncbi:hypothetical protein [Nonomuraea sp. GTA35]|uniref:hypothetical protein n=1 Tax=Nonomuraea sp. GTA35 TaxID=1676746 RepID=UPI0035C1914D
MGFLRPKITGFTGVFPTREAQWKAMFLRGDRVAQIDETRLLSEGPLTEAFGGKLAGLHELIASCSEAVLRVPTSDGTLRMIFIAGDMCMDWAEGKGARYIGLVTELPGFGPYLPKEFRSDVDVIMQMHDYQPNAWGVLLLKGDQCVNIGWNSGTGYQGPISGLREAGWKKLPAQWSGDFDHAVLMHVAYGNYQTLFIKGDQAMQFDWITGPRSIGAYGDVVAGLGALPADYQKLRLPAAGRFSGTSGDMKLDLRIDLQGTLPVVSGDLFSVSSGAYYDSFVLDGGQAVTLPAVISGIAKSALRTNKKMSVSVDKLAPGGTATVTITDASGANTVYPCAYVSRFLRSIDWEIDAVTGMQMGGQYATVFDPRPPGLDKKIITVRSALADAGIELRVSGTPNEVPVAEAAEDLKWSNAELHAAMLKHFSGHKNTEQWKLWSLLATSSADVPAAVGIMFDNAATDNFQRQGIAMFLGGGSSAARTEIHSHVHEIGHALNLCHSWEKNLTVPPQPLGPRNGYGDLSFMNYEHLYEGPNGEKGTAAFWAAFLWQFTPNELRHLRHGYFWDVVMGGRKFGTSAAKQAEEPIALPPPSRSGLRLQLSGRASFSHGEPVVTEIKLSLDGSTSQAEAFPNLSPSGDNLTILITDPAGNVRPFRPIARACGGPDQQVTLDASTPALYDSAYVGYGADGLTFPTPGTYRLRALCKAPDSSTVTSPEYAIEVSPPRDEQDQRAGDLLMGHQQGTLLALLGSDAPQLQEGNAALDTLIADHGDHPLAVYARMVKGANAGRHFLTLGEDGIEVRPADTDTSIAQLGAVVETTLDPGTDAGVDNITLNETMRRLARAHARAGDLKQADVVLDQLVDTFRDKDVPPPVLATIVEQAETARAQLHDQA